MAEEVKINVKSVDNGLSGPVRVLDFSKFKNITNSVYLTDEELSEVATILEKDWSIAFLEQLVLLYTFEFVCDKYLNTAPHIFKLNNSSYPNIFAANYNDSATRLFNNAGNYLSKEVINKIKNIKVSTFNRLESTKLVKTERINNVLYTYELTELGNKIVKDFLQLQNYDNRLLINLIAKHK